MNDLNEEATLPLIEKLSGMGFKFTKDWFTKNLPIWNPLMDRIKPTRILEIGAFEGLSTIFFIDKCSGYGDSTIYSIDSWQGGVEHSGMDFNAIEDAFDHNVQLAGKTFAKSAVEVNKCKGTSLVELAKMVAVDLPKFDLIYIDGSHLATDVLTDAVLSFNLLKVGGILIFDDYNSPNPITPEFPRLGIDSFLTTYTNKVKKILFTDSKGDNIESEKVALYQLYLSKVAD